MPADLLRVLFLGDIFGRPGQTILSENLRNYRARHAIDICMANGENIAGGQGITPRLAEVLLTAGVDMITSGDHIWDKKDIEEYLNTSESLLRPLNYPEDSPGRGITVLETPSYVKICFINLVGRVFMRPADNPFAAVEKALARIDDSCKIRLVDFHAEATSEMIAMGRFLDGKVSAVLGTHTHVQTADSVVMPGGTAYITDAGMTGAMDSVIGLEAREVLMNYRMQVRRRFKPAHDDPCMQGVIMEIETATGKAVSITPIQERFNE